MKEINEKLIKKNFLLYDYLKIGFRQTSFMLSEYHLDELKRLQRDLNNHFKQEDSIPIYNHQIKFLAFFDKQFSLNINHRLNLSDVLNFLIELRIKYGIPPVKRYTSKDIEYTIEWANEEFPKILKQTKKERLETWYKDESMFDEAVEKLKRNYGYQTGILRQMKKVYENQEKKCKQLANDLLNKPKTIKKPKKKYKRK